MAILKSAARLISREHAHYQFRGPALTLGVPEIYATTDEITAWSREYLGAEPAWNIDEVEISTNRFGKRLSWVKARSFFQDIGIGQLDSLDIEGCEYVPEILHDLNTPLPDQFHNQYGLIFDPGTLEHVFDILHLPAKYCEGVDNWWDCNPPGAYV
ncbi:MAG: hypothetical protein R3F24_12020 [Gammaproteobacteria bacterium]